jgi:uncharacterized protein (TIGR02588 family)
MASSSDSKKNDAPTPHGKNALEWAVFALSALLVLSVVGFLGYNAVRGGEGGAHLKCTIASAKALGEDSTEVLVVVENHGPKTAAEVNVTVKGGDAEATFTVDFIPRGGKREGIAVFEGRHDAAGITARVTGYVEP